MFVSPILCILWFFGSWVTVIANTEISNFVATDGQEIVIPQTSKWPTLQPGANEIESSLEWSPHVDTKLQDPVWDPKSSSDEMWVTLDLDHQRWRNHSKFTLRLSWPASSPASFFIQFYTSESLLSAISSSQHSSSVGTNTYTRKETRSRRMYAHIRVVGEADGISTSEHTQHIAFNIILEPLIMGVLPASVQPIVLTLVFVVSVAALIVPWINRYLERLADKARAEATTVNKQ